MRISVNPVAEVILLVLVAVLIITACEAEPVEVTRIVDTQEQYVDLGAGWTQIAGGLYKYEDADNGVVCYRYGSSLFCLELSEEAW